jgi:histidinol phosphatase-like PHP family hydrolase
MTQHLIETHAHTSEVSACGQLPARRIATLVQEAGYETMVTTDHFTNESWEPGISIAARADGFLKGYHIARARGEEIGLSVLLGMEARLCDGPSDYLVFGLSEADVPVLVEGVFAARNLREFSALVTARALLIIQAHPFRYGHAPSDHRYLDGYEVLNGNPRHGNGNDRTRAYVEALADESLILTAGSDAHQTEDVGQTGILAPYAIRDNAALLKFLRENPRPALRGQ